MWSGVGKSGSPAPKPMTSSPAAFSALALASTASVADSAMAPIRSGDPVHACQAGTVTCVRPPADNDPRRPPARPTDASAAARPRCPPRRSPPWPPAGARCSARRTARPPVKDLVGRVRAGLARPVRPARRLGGRARQRRQHRVLGRGHVRAHRAEEPAPAASASSRPSSPPPPTPRPTSAPPDVISAPAGHPPAAGRRSRRRRLRPHPQRDLDRRDDAAASDRSAPTASSLVDATSGAGGLPWIAGRGRRLLLRPAEVLRRPTAGLWLALCSPAAVDRIERINSSGRWIPASLDLSIALENSRLDQTYNTPALATLFLLDQQLQWMNGQGGLDAVRGPLRSGRPTSSTAGPTRSPYATPFVADPAMRSTVVGTIDLDGVDAATVSAVLRANGIVDTESLPQARAQPAAHRHVPGHRPRRRRRPHPLRRLRGRTPGVTARPLG